MKDKFYNQALRFLSYRPQPRIFIFCLWYNIPMQTAKKIKTTTYTFPVIIEKDEDGFFVADCPDLQGCHTQGKTIEEAITNIRDAIKLHVKILKEENQEIPKVEPVSLTSLEVTV